MRLIDADELRKNVLKWMPSDPCGKEEKEFPFETDICASMVMEIDDAPTVQPETNCSEFPNNSDTISRQAAIDFVGSMNMCDEISNEACKKLTSYLDELPSAQPEHRWIPCSERLPVPYEDVWCCSDIGQVVGYCDATGFWVGRGELELIVTAWMPLPEPYKGTER